MNSESPKPEQDKPQLNPLVIQFRHVNGYWAGVEAAWAGDPEEIDVITMKISQMLGSGFSCYPYSSAKEPEPKDLFEFEKLLEIQNPQARLSYLAEPSRVLNQIITAQCLAIGDEDLLELIEIARLSYQGKNLTDELHSCLTACFNEIMSRTVRQVETDSEVAAYFNQKIDGSYTFNQNIELFTMENAPLMPLIICGLIDKVSQVASVSSNEAVKALLEYGFEGLNACIYGLRVGKNTSIQAGPPMATVFDVETEQGRIKMISLNEQVLEVKRNKAQQRNKAVHDMVSRLKEAIKQIEAEGIKILFNYRLFGHYLGVGGFCPLTLGDQNATSYSNQVRLAMRVMNLYLKSVTNE